MNRSLLVISFTLLTLTCGPGLRAAPPYSRTDGTVWLAGNDSIEIGVNKATGRIERLLDKVSQEDYCNQSLKNATSDTDGSTGIQFNVGERIAGLTLIDELRDREFSDLTNPGAISNAKESRTAEAVSLSFDKRYPGAEFTVSETFSVAADHVRWDVRIRKTAGPDRTVRVVQFAPLPLGQYQAWAPISDAPFAVKPWLPFSIDYGQSTSGAVGEGRWRTTIPMMVFYSNRTHRAISFTSPFEVPAVRIRFLTNTGAAADFHWNSRKYPLRERPYFQVSNEYLGVRDNKDLETGLLISSHPADWRPALGWVYSKYRKYFDPDPRFDRFDGGYVITGPMADALPIEEQREIVKGRYERGVRWEELHGHFPWYGLMIQPADVKDWVFRESPSRGITMTRDKIRRQLQVNKDVGVGTFIYYNITESVWDYAKQKFPESVARDENGDPIGAWMIRAYPNPNACWLMNADSKTPFGKHMAQQARELVSAYPEIDGFFWDVYGRSYMFDFAHDDGITMVNNKPAYYPLFMYQRMMREVVGPLLHGSGKLITANKPVTITSCDGLDGIMAMEDAPREESPPWITAQSYLGLNRHVMILESNGANAEMMYLHCLRYGMFDTDLRETDRKGSRLPAEAIAHNRDLARKYRPFIEKFRGKQWVFYPEALELPQNTFGNVFRLKDGSVMITMVSAWRHLRNAEGFDSNLEVTCRLPDAGELKTVRVTSVDLGDSSNVEPRREGDALKITVPKHGKATVIFLSR